MSEDVDSQSPRRLLGGRFAMLLGLTGLAISQPLLNVLSGSPETFTFHDFDSADIVVFALALAFVPPILLWLVETAAHFINENLGRWLHLAFSGALFALFVRQLLVQVGVEWTAVAWVLSISTGVLLGLALVRSATVGQWLSLIGILPVVAVALFLFSSPVADLVNPPDRAEVVALPQREDTEPPPSVIMILFDELPTQTIINTDEQIDSTRFPNFAEFADDSTWYRHSTTMSQYTATAAPAILTGVEPAQEGNSANWIDYPDNLFRLLGGSHHLAVSESATKLCGVEGCTSVPQPPPSAGESSSPQPNADFEAMWDITADLFKDRISPSTEENLLDDFEESVESVERDPSATSETTKAVPLEEPSQIEIEWDSGATRVAKQPSRLTEFIDAIHASPEPTLYYLHLLLPHQPSNLDAEGTEYTVPSGAAGPNSTNGQWLTATRRQRHMIQTSYTDLLLGQILDKAKSEGIYDDSLVVVMSDHGLGFEPFLEGREFLPETRASIAYAPLFVKSPGQTEGSVSDVNATIVDVLPTIAAELGVTIPWEVDGSDLASSEVADRGPTKRMYDWVPDPKLSLGEVVDFDDDDVYEELLTGLFPPMSDPDDPLSGLWATTDAADLVGARLSELTPSGDPPIDIEVAEGDSLTNGDERPPLGYVSGFITEPDFEVPSDAVMAVVVDDTIVAISEIPEKGGRPGWFGTPLPSKNFAPVDLDLYLVNTSTETVTGTAWIE